MKIAIPVNGDQVTVCPSFGRAPYFWVSDTESGDKSVLENPAAHSEGGAGIRAAQAVLDLGCGGADHAQAWRKRGQCIQGCRRRAVHLGV